MILGQGFLATALRATGQDSPTVCFDAQWRYPRLLTVQPLMEAQQQGITKWVYASSVAAGNGTPYGAFKRAEERFLAQEAHKYGLNVVWVRLPTLCGGMGRRSWLVLAVKSLLKGESLWDIRSVQWGARTMQEAA